jgi:release factor glutamine methyltransferase
VTKIHFEGPRREQLLGAALRVLTAQNVEDPDWLARELLCRCLGFSRVELQLHLDAEVSAEEQQHFADWLQRFAAGEPLAYLEGSCGFYGREFAVDARVLVPRPDSESLIEAALALCDPTEAIQLADVGTGSGCLLLTLLAELPAARGVGIDLSGEALQVAWQNREALGLTGRCELVQGSWLSPLAADGSLDLVVSNPPYIEPGEEMGPGVEDFEPHLALFTAPNDPLGPYRAILDQARHCLREGGWLIFEVGAGRAEQVAQAGIRAGFSLVETRSDLGGVARAVVLQNQAQA